MSDDEMTEDAFEAWSEDDETDDESGDDEFLPLPLPFNFSSSRRRTVQTPANRSYAGSGMTMWVNRIEFNQSVQKVQADIAQLSTGIKQVNSRVSTLASATTRQGQAIVKQNKALAAQGKALVGLRKQVKKAQDDALFMSLLLRPKTTTPTTTPGGVLGAPIPVGSRIPYETSDGISPLLLMLLMSNDSSSSLGSNNLLPLLLLSNVL